MAEAATAAVPVGDEESGKSPGRRKVVILLVLALVVGAGAFVAMRLLSGPPAQASTAEPEPVEGAVLEVAEMTATLSGDVPHLARVGFAVVLEESADSAVVESKFALLKDAAVTELAQSSAESLVTPEGVDDLRSRLTVRAHDIYPDGEVLRVVLTGLVVQ
jgi:flagellar basal body-associated protein FliL